MNKLNQMCEVTLVELGNTPFHINEKLSLIFIVKGILKMSCVSGPLLLRENDIDIINIKEPVKLEAITPSCTILVLLYNKTIFGGFDIEIKKKTYNCNMSNFYSTVADKRDIYALTEMMLDICTDYFSGINEIEFSVSAKNILTFISSHFDDVDNMLNNAFKIEVSRERFKKIIGYIMDNYSQKISLREIADYAFLSLQYLSKEFTDRLEKNYIKVLNYYRTINTIRDLLNTDDTITNIAEKNGFSSLRYCNRTFKEYMGCSPLEFRKNNKYGKFNYNKTHITIQEGLLLTQELKNKISAAARITIPETNFAETVVYADHILKCSISMVDLSKTIRIAIDKDDVEVHMAIKKGKNTGMKTLMKGDSIGISYRLIPEKKL